MRGAVTMRLKRGVGLVFFGAILASACGLFSGCSSNRAPMKTEIVPYTDEQLLARDMAKEARYRLRTGDRFKLTFKYEKELNQENLVVLPDGYISISGHGNVKAAGLTLDELNATLTEQYAVDFRNPYLTVVLQEISDPEVYVLGEVEKPGLVKMPSGGAGILQAIAMAGGFRKDANRDQAVVLRAAEQGFLVRTFDFGEIQAPGEIDLDIFDVQPFDIIYVPRSHLGDFAYLSQAVFGSALNVTRFFWDIYAIANVDKIDRIVR